jgi:hypothetical protein
MSYVMAMKFQEGHKSGDGGGIKILAWAWVRN